MNNELLDIVEVIETTEVNELNELLNKGWKLITTCNKLVYLDTPQHQRICYSLGRFKDF